MDDVSNQFGSAMAANIKAYIDDAVAQRLGEPITDIDTEESTDDTVSAEAYRAQVFFVDPFEAAKTPLSLSLPSAFSHISPTLAAHSDKDIVIMTVSASDWALFYRRLLSASLLRPEFLETATKVQERFGFNYNPADDYRPEILNILAGDSASPLSHWLSLHDQVYSSVALLMYESGRIPEEFLL